SDSSNLRSDSSNLRSDSSNLNEYKRRCTFNQTHTRSSVHQMDPSSTTKKRKQYSSDLRTVIVAMRSKGLSVRQISNLTNMPTSSVHLILQLFGKTGTTEIEKRSGRPAKLSDREKRHLKVESIKDPRLPATELAIDLNKNRPNDPVCSKTVQRVLVAAGLPGRRPAYTSYINRRNRRKRLEFAREHLNWTPRQWTHVLWTDESKFELFSEGVQYVHRPVNKRFDPKYTIPTVKHGGGSVMVWGCFIGGKVGPLVRIEGIMKKEDYKKIMKKEMIPWAKANCPARWKFQQDNDPKHTSKLVMKWFKKKNIKKIEWPSQSPDLNPIENLWEVLDEAVRKQKPTNAADKFRILKEAWEKIPSDTLLDLAHSMKDRCAAVIESKGYPTKY
ncbi:hypothetical protein PENTCL1PPCAC_10561, partial [Pristionchus entomophagus]